MIDVVNIRPERRIVKRAVAALVTVLMATAVGLLTNPTSAAATHGDCNRLDCTGKYPGKQDCTPGVTRKARWGINDGYASIRLMHSGHCNGTYWARFVLDQNPASENFPERWRIKVVRQQINEHTGWVRTHIQKRTIKKGVLDSTPPGSYNSRMIPYSAAGLDKRYRACAKQRVYYSGDWGPWSGWMCTSWTSF